MSGVTPAGNPVAPRGPRPKLAPMIKTLRLVLAFTAAAAFCAAPALAGTVKFPKKEPLMSFELPDGWRSETDAKGQFTAKPPGDDEFALTLIKMDGVKDEDTAKKALPIIAKAACEATGAKGVVVSDIKDLKAGKKGDIKMALCEAKGTDGSGNKFVVTACSIEADDEYIALATVTTEAKDKKYTPTMGKIVESMEEGH